MPTSNDFAIPARKANPQGIVLAGLAAGLLLTVFALCYAEVLFGGSLSGYVPLGVSLALIAAILQAVIVGAGSSHPGTIAGVSTETLILGIATGSIAAVMLTERGPEATAATVLVVIAFASLGFGVLCLILSIARFGNVVRYLPFPVLGGFLGGVGWLSVIGGVAAATRIGRDDLTMSVLAEPGLWLRWMPPLLLGIALSVVQRRYGSYLIVPVVIVGALVVFFAGAAVVGFGPQALLEAGWLLGPFPDERTASPLVVLKSLSLVDWGVIVSVLPELLTFIVLAGVGALLIGTSVEVIVDDDVDSNRDLRAIAAANIVGSPVGAMPGYHYAGCTTLVIALRGHSRLTAMLAAAVCAFALYGGADLATWIPRPLIAMVLFFIGCELITTWIVDSADRLPRGDYMLVLVVFATIIWFGFIEGVAIGLAAGMAFFAYNYSRIEVVSRSLSLASMHSRISRPAPIEQVLRERGGEARILLLEGFIFFGTVNRLIGNVRRLADEDPNEPLRTLILDFRRVRGLDSAAAAGFTRMVRLGRQRSFEIILSGATPDISNALEHEGLLPERRMRQVPRPEGDRRRAVEDRNRVFRIRRFDDLDKALEWSEEAMLRRFGIESVGGETVLEDYLNEHFEETFDVDRFAAYGQSSVFEAEHDLVRQGDAADEIYFIVSGELSVRLTLPTGESIRLRRIGAGTAVGEVALYLGGTRTASVTTERRTEVLCYSREALANMRRKDPDLYATFHEMMAKVLAHRLTDLSRVIDALNG